MKRLTLALWVLALLGLSAPAAAGTIYNFDFTIGPNTGYGWLFAEDCPTCDPGGLHVTSGNLTVTGGALASNSYPLYPSGPAPTDSPNVALGFYFITNNVLYPMNDPQLDENGLLFRSAGGFEVNIYYLSGGYSFCGTDGLNDYSPCDYDVRGSVFNVTAVPEPATLLLLGAGLGAVAARRRLKKRA